MTLRGDINAVLNRLVREGVISAFETNSERGLTLTAYA